MMYVKMGRCLLAAGIVRDFRFKNKTWFDVYLSELDRRQIEYKVLETCLASDGSYLVRIVTEYNDTPLIELYD